MMHAAHRIEAQRSLRIAHDLLEHPDPAARSSAADLIARALELATGATLASA